MEAKKSKKSDLENKKNLFFQIGIGITLVAVLFAFDNKQYERRGIDWDNKKFEIVDIEKVPITIPEKPTPPPPEPSKELIIVPDDVNIDDEFHIDVDAFIDEPIPDYTVYVHVEDEIDTNYIFEIVEDYPEFPGGNQALFSYLSDHIKYPRLANRAKIQGTVHLTFVIEPDGSISNIEIVRGLGGGCNEEAIRVVKNMPKWEPGKQRGVPVRVQFHLPIRFRLLN